MPGEACYLSVNAHHPELGAFFAADFKGRRSSSALHSDTAGLSLLLRYGSCPLTGIKQGTFPKWVILLRTERLKLCCVAMAEPLHVRPLVDATIRIACDA